MFMTLPNPQIEGKKLFNTKRKALAVLIYEILVKLELMEMNIKTSKHDNLKIQSQFRFNLELKCA